MENFDARPQQRIKEKSVYLLHLDTPRIIIISCVVIAVLIVAFLIGMNVKGDGERAQGTQIAHNDLLFNTPPPPPPGDQSQNADPTAPGSAPQTLDDELGMNQMGQTPAPSAQGQPATQTVEPEKKSRATSPAAVDRKSGDVLAQDSIREIIPPSRASSGTERRSVAPKRATAKADTGRQNRREAARRNQRTVEVASSERESQVRSASGESGYAIQVGSFDSRERAAKEARNLKNLRYDARVEDTHVNGRNMYRVKVGPISSRSRAVRVLSEIQEMRPYEGSYLVRE
jgi:cell division protein FtsN